MPDHLTRVREQALGEALENIGGHIAQAWFIEGAAWLASRLTREKIADAVEEVQARWQMQFELFRAGEDEDPGPKAEFVADAILALMVEGEK